MRAAGNTDVQRNIVGWNMVKRVYFFFQVNLMIICTENWAKLKKTLVIADKWKQIEQKLIFIPEHDTNELGSIFAHWLIYTSSFSAPLAHSKKNLANQSSSSNNK